MQEFFWKEFGPRISAPYPLFLQVDEPVNLPMDCALQLHVERVEKQPKESSANSQASLPLDERPLMKLVRLLESLPDNPDAPRDGAAQHDHYL